MTDWLVKEFEGRYDAEQYLISVVELLSEVPAGDLDLRGCFCLSHTPFAVFLGLLGEFARVGCP